MGREDKHFRLRIPDDLMEWVKARAARNLRSVTAEVVFLLREEMVAGGTRGGASPNAGTEAA